MKSFMKYLIGNRRRSLNIYKLQFISTSRHRIITAAVTRMSVSRYMLIRSISAFVARYVCLTRSTPQCVGIRHSDEKYFKIGNTIVEGKGCILDVWRNLFRLFEANRRNHYCKSCTNTTEPICFVLRFLTRIIQFSSILL